MSELYRTVVLRNLYNWYRQSLQQPRPVAAAAAAALSNSSSTMIRQEHQENDSNQQQQKQQQQHSSDRQGVLVERGQLPQPQPSLLRALTAEEKNEEARRHLIQQRFNLFQSDEFRQHVYRDLGINPRRDIISTDEGLIAAAMDPTLRQLSIHDRWQHQFRQYYIRADNNNDADTTTNNSSLNSDDDEIDQENQLDAEDVAYFLGFQAEQERLARKRPMRKSKLGQFVTIPQPLRRSTRLAAKPRVNYRI
jgi:type III secretory pathway component EscV